MEVIRSRDFLSGLMFAAFGVVAYAGAQDLARGTANEMGPGFFPVMLAYGLVGLGILLIGRSFFAARHSAEAVQWRPLLLIVLAVVLFGVLAERAGLLAAIVALMAAGGLASFESRWREVALSAIALSAFAVLIFVWALSVPLPVLPR